MSLINVGFPITLNIHLLRYFMFVIQMNFSTLYMYLTKFYLYIFMKLYQITNTDSVVFVSSQIIRMDMSK